MLAVDTETRIDAAQALTFGSYRFFDDGVCLEEGLFYADDLPAADRGALQAYVKTHAAATDRRVGLPELRLLSKIEFLDKLYIAAYKTRALICGFNLPFDLSRLACKSSNARDRFTGGFSLTFWDYVDDRGERAKTSIAHGSRSSISTVNVRSRASAGRLDPDETDLIPEGSTTGEPDRSYGFRGHFLDLRTLAFALTDRGHSLQSACDAFGVREGKGSADRHGVVSDSYIDYNRQDVAATAALAFKLLEEYDLLRH